MSQLQSNAKQEILREVRPRIEWQEGILFCQIAFLIKVCFAQII